MAQLSRTLIRDNLVPEQQSYIGEIGALFILVSLLFTLVYWSNLHRHLRVFAIVSCLALTTLMLVQIFFVVTVDNYGEPPAAHRYLVGFKLSGQGETWVSRVGANRSRADYIKDVGSDRIEEMYGVSYQIVALAYSVTYLAFVFGVIMTLGGLLRLSGENAAAPP